MAAMAFRKMSVIASCSDRAAAEVKEKTWFSGPAAPAGWTTTFKATFGLPAGVCWRSKGHNQSRRTGVRRRDYADL